MWMDTLARPKGFSTMSHGSIHVAARPWQTNYEYKHSS
jgi:hypothetical protein